MFLISVMVYVEINETLLSVRPSYECGMLVLIKCFGNSWQVLVIKYEKVFRTRKLALFKGVIMFLISVVVYVEMN